MAACANLAPVPSVQPAVPDAPTTSQPPAAVPAPAQPAALPPPPVNLQGFPPSYQQGFADGCATGRGAEKKDPTRYSADGNYRIGWVDGLAQCRRK
jgi:hypothetical protein